MPDDSSEPGSFWNWQDEVESSNINMRYSNRQRMLNDAIKKKKAFQDTTPDNQLYHRIAVSAEMARMRVDMAYLIAENIHLKGQIGTIRWLHDQLGILQGAYAHNKMLAEQARIDYAKIAKGLEDIGKLKEGLLNEVKQRNNKPDGAES